MINNIPVSIIRKGLVIVSLILNSLCLFCQQTISEIKLLPPGSVVTTSGTITTGPEFGQIRYMQDAEAGIALYSTSLSERVPGDSIIVTGVISNYQDQLQLSPVLSHQLVASSAKLPPNIEIDLSDPQIDSYESMLVSLPCIGISTCESVFDADWFTIFDHNGIPVRMTLPESHSLIDQGIPSGPAAAHGIWTKQNDIYTLLVDTIQQNNSDGYIINVGEIGYDQPGLATITWKVNGIGDYRIEYGEIEYDSFDVVFPNQGEVQYTFQDSLESRIYKVRLYQNFSGNDIYSLPVYFSPKRKASLNYELFFNRNVDTTFSDGSYANGVGSNVIASDVISRIDDVDSTLDIAMYNTTNDQLVSAVKRAAQRGVRVRYIADDETSNSSLQGVSQFPVLYRSGDGIMHHKFLIGDADTDHAWLWTGSTNFSTNQLSSDPNHAYVFHSKALAQNYKLEFEELWGMGDNHHDAKSGDNKTDNTSHQFLIGETYIESYFSPSDETNCHIIDALHSADHHIEIGLLLLTKENLVDELIELHQNGVDIRVIVEDQESSSLALSRLNQAGISTAIHDFSPIFHHKYAIIDEGYPGSDPMVITGSHNWTYSADNINDENTLIVHDQSFANIFRQEFEARWSELITSPVEVISNNYEIILHPNPAEDFIELTNLKNVKCKITLLDIHGAIISKNSLAPHQVFKLNIDKTLPDGIYLLHWKWNNSFATSRFVIQK